MEEMMNMLGFSDAMKNDFAKFNKAIDDAIANGMTEDEAIEFVSSNWSFEDIK